MIFKDMFMVCAGRLLTIEHEFTKGMEKEMQRFINDKVATNIDEIWANAKLKYNNRIKAGGVLIKIFDHSSGIDDFHSDFKIALSEFALAELKKIDGNIAQVFKQKKTIEEVVAELRKGDETENSNTEKSAEKDVE